MMLVGKYEIYIHHVQERQFKYEIKLADGTLLACGTNDDTSEMNDDIIHALMALIRMDLSGFTKERLYGHK